MNFIVASNLTYTLDFEIFYNFDHISTSFVRQDLFDLFWAKNMNCQYKYLTNQTQLGK